MKPPRLPHAFPICLLACGLVLTALAAVAQSPPGTVEATREAPEKGALSVRAVTFRVSSDTALHTLEGTIDGDTGLFQRLAGMVAAGEAEVAGDQSLSLRSGHRAKVEAVSELIYPTEWLPFPRTLTLAPTAWETRNEGDTLETEAAAPASASVVDATVSLESVRWQRTMPVPVLIGEGRAWKEAQAPQPLFITKNMLASLTAVEGAPLLISILPAGNVEEPGRPTDSGARLTFALVQKAGAPPPKPLTNAGHGTPDHLLRLHTLGFRVPGAVTERWLADPDFHDAAALAEAQALAAQGQATLIHHHACLARSGLRCRANSYAEFTYSTDLELTMNTHYVGSLTEFEPVWHADRRTLDLALAVEEMGRPWQEEIPADANSVRLRLPAFPRTYINTALDAPLGSVRLLGIAEAPPEASQHTRLTGLSDVYFLKTVTPKQAAEMAANPPASDPPAGVLRIASFLYSLSPEEGAAAHGALASAEDQRLAAQEIEERWREGSCPLVAHAALTARSGATATLASGVERTLGLTFDPSTNHRKGSGRHPRTEGFSLKATPVFDPETGHTTLTLDCQYDAAPAQLPATVHLDEAPPQAAHPVVNFSATQYLETFSVTEAGPFALDETRVIAVQPSLAPAGPEADRWHALLVRITQPR